MEHTGKKSGQQRKGGEDKKIGTLTVQCHRLDVSQ